MKPKVVTVDASLNEKTPILGGKKAGCLEAFPTRYGLAILGFLGIFNVHAMRVNLSVAMVAMVRKPYNPESLEDTGTVACQELMPYAVFRNTSELNEAPAMRGEFDWDSRTQGLILGSFFYGYIVTQVPGGIIAEKYGAKWPFGIGVLITAIFTLLTPVAARWSVWALIAARIIEGLGEGVTYPAINAMFGRWIPKLERSRMASFLFSGSPIGTVVSLSASGILSQSKFLGGWPSVFYVFGTIACIWFLFWITLVYETPDDHPRITKAELILIHEGQEPIQLRNRPLPWRAILTSPYLYSLAVTHFGYSWGFNTLLTEMPTYLSNILHFDLKKNGTLSSLPYLVKAFMAYFISFPADKIRGTGRFTITAIRKFINSFAFFIPGICVLCVAFVGCNPVVIVALLTIAVGFNGFSSSGFNIAHVDMSPEFAGTLMGITNSVGNIAGFLAPAYVGWITQDGQSLRNWGIVFITASALYFLTGSIYNIFGTAELQPWGEMSKEMEKRKNVSETVMKTTPLRRSSCP